MMLKKNVFILFFLLASCQEKSQKKEPINGFTNSITVKENSNQINLDSLYKSVEKNSPLDFFLNKYADSINQCKGKYMLPHFLKDLQFDYRHVGIFTPFHHPCP